MSLKYQNICFSIELKKIKQKTRGAKYYSTSFPHGTYLSVAQLTSDFVLFGTGEELVICC